MRKQVKRTKQEQEYRRRYYELKTTGMIKKETRILSHKEYLNSTKQEGMNNSDILEGQTRARVRNKREATRLNKELAERTESRYSKGWAKKHWDEAHDDIASRIDAGENREDVLADYGY